MSAGTFTGCAEYIRSPQMSCSGGLCLSLTIGTPKMPMPKKPTMGLTAAAVLPLASAAAEPLLVMTRDRQLEIPPVAPLCRLMERSGACAARSLLVPAAAAVQREGQAPVDRRNRRQADTSRRRCDLQ